MTTRLVLSILLAGAVATLIAVLVAGQRTPAQAAPVATPSAASATPVAPVIRPSPMSVPALPAPR